MPGWVDPETPTELPTITIYPDHFPGVLSGSGGGYVPFPWGAKVRVGAAFLMPVPPSQAMKPAPDVDRGQGRPPGLQIGGTRQASGLVVTLFNPNPLYPYPAARTLFKSGVTNR